MGIAQKRRNEFVRLITPTGFPAHPSRLSDMLPTCVCCFTNFTRASYEARGRYMASNKYSIVQVTVLKGNDTT
jgi:hypothetical protein